MTFKTVYVRKAPTDLIYFMLTAYMSSSIVSRVYDMKRALFRIAVSELPQEITLIY